MPGRSVRSARWPLLKSSSEASNGRQVMRSPAVPASSLAFSAALYSVGADGEKMTLMPGLACFEGRDQLVLPDRQVVVAPALDGQRHVLGEGRAGRAEDARAEQQSGKRRACHVLVSQFDLFRFAILRQPVVAGSPSEFRVSQVPGAVFRPRRRAASGGLGIGRARGDQDGGLDRAIRLFESRSAACSSQPAMAATMRAARPRSLTLSAWRLTM